MIAGASAGRTPVLVILAVVVVGAALASGVLYLGRPPLRSGEEQKGLDRYLFEGDRILTEADGDAIDALVERVNARLRGGDSGAPPALVEQLPAIAAETLVRAIERSDRLGLSETEAGRALRDLDPTALTIRWTGTPFDGEALLSSTISTSGPAPPDHGAVFPAGCSIAVEVSAQVRRWPVGPIYTEHPELVMPQARVEWVSRELTAFVVAEALVEVVSERTAQVLEALADDAGWVASSRFDEPVQASRSADALGTSRDRKGEPR